MYNIKNISKLIVEELLNELFEKYFENYIKISDTDYIVKEPEFNINYTFRYEFVNKPNDPIIFKGKPIINYYSYRWFYDQNTPLDIKNDDSTWKKSTKTSLIILNEFLKTKNPPLVTFSPNGGKTEKIYFHNVFYRELLNNIPTNYNIVVDFQNKVIMLINNEYTNFTERLTIL